MTSASPVTDVVVALDVYPARVLLPDGSTTYLAVRVTVADEMVQVWRNEAAGPALVFIRTLTGWSGNIRIGYNLQTEDGTLVVAKDGGCGCGARLGNADLWPNRRRVNTVLS